MPINIIYVIFVKLTNKTFIFQLKMPNSFKSKLWFIFFKLSYRLCNIAKHCLRHLTKNLTLVCLLSGVFTLHKQAWGCIMEVWIIWRITVIRNILWFEWELLATFHKTCVSVLLCLQLTQKWPAGYCLRFSSEPGNHMGWTDTDW